MAGLNNNESIVKELYRHMNQLWTIAARAPMKKPSRIESAVHCPYYRIRAVQLQNVSLNVSHITSAAIQFMLLRSCSQDTMGNSAHLWPNALHPPAPQTSPEAITAVNFPSN